VLLTGASKHMGNDAFCIIGNVGKLKDAATRCVLRIVDASKYIGGWGLTERAYSASPDPSAGFGGNVEGTGKG